MVENAKNIVFYNENGQKEYATTLSKQIKINKILNYVGKQIQSASIEITTGITGYTEVRAKHVLDAVYTLGAENEEDFFSFGLAFELLFLN